MNLNCQRKMPSIWLAMLFVTLSTSCNGDLRWTQKAFVPVPNIGFEGCVKAGITQVPGVSITRFQFDRYTLNVDFQKPMPGVGAFIQKDDAANVEILFFGKNWHESDNERAAITPILNALKEAIARNCMGLKSSSSH